MMVIWLMDTCLEALLPEIENIYRCVGVVQEAPLIKGYNIGFIVVSFIFCHWVLCWIIFSLF